MSKKDYVKDKQTTWVSLILRFLFIGILAIMMIGLKNSTKIEHVTFVSAIGIDKSPTDPNKVMVTFQLMPPQVTSQSSSDIEKVTILSINEDSLQKAIASAHNYISASINFSHTRVLIISQDVAKDGIYKYLNEISSNGTFDMNMYLMISKENSYDFLSSLPKDTEINPALYYNILKNSEALSGSTKTITVMEFIKKIFDPYINPCAPVCSLVKGNNNDESSEKDNTISANSPPTNKLVESDILKNSNIKIEIGGLGVFRKDKLLTLLSAEETAYHIMLTSKLKGHYFTLFKKSLDSSSLVETDVYIKQEEKAKIKVNVESDIPNIDVTIPLNAVILDTQDNNYNYFDSSKTDVYREYILDKLESDIKKYSTKLQKEYNIDIEEYFHYARYSFLTENSLNEYEWDKKFKDANITFKFDLKFISSGLNVRK